MRVVRIDTGRDRLGSWRDKRKSKANRVLCIEEIKEPQNQKNFERVHDNVTYYSKAKRIKTDTICLKIAVICYLSLHMKSIFPKYHKNMHFDVRKLKEISIWV